MSNPVKDSAFEGIDEGLRQQIAKVTREFHHNWTTAPTEVAQKAVEERFRIQLARCLEVHELAHGLMDDALGDWKKKRKRRDDT